MEPIEYDRLAAAEDDHWWFVGLRDLLSKLVAQYGNAVSPPQRCLDIGCGTGAHLGFMQSLYPNAEILGFDSSERAVQFAQQKCPRATVWRDDLRRLEHRLGSIDFAMCMDVLYAIGLEEARQGMETLVRSLAPGAIMILHFPAYEWLRSYHDEAVHTRERVTLPQVNKYIASLGLQPLFISYRMSLLLPLIVAKRFVLQPLAGRRATPDTAVPSERWNRFWLSVVQAENRLLANRVHLPCGSSIVAVARR